MLSHGRTLDGGTVINKAGSLPLTQDESEGLPISTVSPKMADTCGQVLLGSGLTVLSHPLMYIKVLIQVRGEGSVQTLGGVSALGAALDTFGSHL